jgi:hypothetical protein
MPLPLKALGIVTISVPCIVIAAEKSGEAFDRSQWTGIGKQEMDAVAAREDQRWGNLSFGEKLGDWGKRNKFGILGTA